MTEFKDAPIIIVPHLKTGLVFICLVSLLIIYEPHSWIYP